MTDWKYGDVIEHPGYGVRMLLCREREFHPAWWAVYLVVGPVWADNGADIQVGHVMTVGPDEPENRLIND